MKCKHKWVAMEDGSLRKFCVRCAKFAMQAQLGIPAQVNMTMPTAQPMLRETIEVPFYNGSDHVRVSVYKDQFIDQLRKEQGLFIDHFSSASR